jgi:hypothetical protein
MPESVTDRPTKSHEYVFLLTKSPRYFFDQEAVREAYQPASIERKRYATNDMRSGSVAHDGRVKAPTGANYVYRDNPPANPAGRNLRSVWEIATQPYPEAHFATYPEELVRRCILAGTSERGCCPECGTPWERKIIFGELNKPRTKGLTPWTAAQVGQHDAPGGLPLRERIEQGWRSNCGCSSGRSAGNEWVAAGAVIRPTGPIPCTVLDPFLGSGTTAYVARKHGRRSIGIELNSGYCQLAAQRMQQLSLFADTHTRETHTRA